ncbi:MAG: ATP-dependent Clp protease ATP-binding subunit [Candidatus Acidiferrales bacterium]
MFERYTEKARRVIFFARYEASQYGSPYIETEHLLLGLLREDKALANRFLRSHGSIESIRKEIEARITVRERISTSVEVPLSQECKRILNFAAEEAERLGHKHVGTEHLLLGVLREEKSFGAEILLERGLRLSTVREELSRSAGEKVPVNRPKEASLLAEFSRDLTQAAMEGQLDPLVGRDRELERAIQILCRRTKNNPVLIGEPGVGKTAIVEGLAQRIADGDVPPFLADKRILSLDLSLIVAGTKYRGQFEERLKTIMKELMESQNAIVFIDELHTLVGAGSAEGSLDAANILKPALSRGEIQCIGATTPSEYRKSVEKDRSLERRFQSVKVPAPGEDEAIRVLQGVRDRYEKFHAVSYTDEALRYSVYLSNRYIPDRFLPDKAIDLLDEAGSRVKLRQAMLPDEVSEVQKRVKFITHRMETAIANHEFEKARFYSEEERKEKEHLRLLREKLKIDDSSTGIVTREDIEEVVARWTGIQVSSIKEDEQQKLLRIEEELHRRVISQDKAITALARAIRRSRAGLKAPGRPVGCFLFLGPTGVGKTEVARRLAEFLFGSEKSLIRFDMSEYMEKHSVSKLIGAPPGYVGYEEGGQLTERVRRTPYCVILLDEIEKAHPDVYNILLQVFEDGQLTDGIGNTVDFRNTIIILTSNLGARQLQKQTGLGFQTVGGEAAAKSQDDMVMGEVKRVFNPEFLNRLDEVILFNSLSDEDLLRIIDLLVGQINETLVHRQVQIALTPEARQWILEKTCSDRNYGARPLRRALQKYVEDPLSEALIQGGLQRPATLEIYLSADGLAFRPVVEATPVAH